MDHKVICMKDELKDDTERFCACNICDGQLNAKKVKVTKAKLAEIKKESEAEIADLLGAPKFNLEEFLDGE